MFNLSITYEYYRYSFLQFQILRILRIAIYGRRALDYLYVCNCKLKWKISNKIEQLHNHFLQVFNIIRHSDTRRMLERKHYSQISASHHISPTWSQLLVRVVIAMRNVAKPGRYVVRTRIRNAYVRHYVGSNVLPRCKLRCNVFAPS